MTAPVPGGLGRGDGAGWPLSSPDGVGTRLALLFSILLLLTSSIQARQDLRVPPGMGPAEVGHSAPRLARTTPFWRTVGSKPLGAHCRHGLECVTKACRAGRCTTPQYEC